MSRYRVGRANNVSLRWDSATKHVKHLYLGLASESFAMAMKLVFSGRTRDLGAYFGAIAIKKIESLKEI